VGGKKKERKELCCVLAGLESPSPISTRVREKRKKEEKNKIP
jgi:hypothetical protein